MSDMINPYIAGAPVTEAGMFFGRQDVFEWIERSLPGRYVDHVLVIHGQRRVGKTSVLKQLHHRLPDQYVPVFFDLQGRTRTSHGRFLWWLAREITRTLRQEYQITLPMPERETFADDLEYLENHFLPGLQPHLDGRSLLLTFDEFDSLQEEEISETLARPLIDTLRRLTGRTGLNFIFSIGSSGQKLENMRASYTEFFKTALYKQISFLGREDTLSLITRPAEGLLEYDQEATSRIYAVTSGHPYFTQLLCHELFSLCQQSGERRIRETDVEAVLEDVVERGTVNLKFVWDEASDLEKWILASLAQMEDLTNPHVLAQTLENKRVRFTRQDLESSLLHLHEKDILTEDNHFVVYLMRLWLQKNRPLERVREELVEISPIANRYIEIGLEFRGAGRYEKASESFQAALAADPENLQAQVNLAAIYLEQQKVEEAAKAYEQALILDEDDVAARAGLCQANLALGDQALAGNSIEEAVGSYRRVLTINAEHTDARQKLADIYHQKAERSLEEGNITEALPAFRQALQYTPEDPDLQDLFVELREGYGPQVMAELKVQAQEKEEDERWNEAIATWQAYLVLEPEDSHEATVALEMARRMRALQASYGQAQEALVEQDYTRAIELLQQIVQIDLSYKDSTRLLAVAVEGSRKQQRNWLRWMRYAVPLLIILLIAGAYYGLRVTGNLPAVAFFQTTATPTRPRPTSTVTPTPRPSPTPVSESEWVTEFAEPILAVIEDQQPQFEDDFSTDRGVWRLGDESNQYVEWLDGRLRLSGGNGQGGGVELKTDTPEFIARFEFEPAEISPSSYFNVILTDPEYGRAYANFNLSEGWQILDSEPFAGDSQGLPQDPVSWWGDGNDQYSARELTLLSADNRLAVYLDGHPLNAISEAFTTIPNDGMLFNLSVWEEFDNVVVDINNFRFWDLRDLPVDPIAEYRRSPRPMPASDPEWVTDFAEPILAEIESRSPQFEDDFSSRLNFWEVHSESVQWVDGLLLLSGGADQDPNVGFRNNSENGFAMEFQFKIDESSKEGEFTVFFLTDQGHELFVNFGLNGSVVPDSRGTIHLESDAWYEEDTTWWELAGTGPFEPHELTIIGRDDQLALYIDGKPLNAFSYFPSGTGPFAMGIPPSGSMLVEVDDFRYWNLHVLEREPFAKEILANIAEVAPAFEEDFTNPAPSWGDIQPGLPLSDFVQESTLVASFIDDTTLENSLFVYGPLTAKDFVLELELLAVNFPAPESEIWIHFRSDPDPENDERYIIRFDEQGRWFIDMARQGISTLLQEGITSEIQEGILTRVRLIAFRDQFFLYLNDIPTAYFQDSTLQFNDNFIQLSSDAQEFQVEIDNIRLWLLETETCLITHSTWLKREPASDAPVNPLGEIEIGTPATIIESISGVDGDIWHYIEAEPQSGTILSGYVPESALSEVCFQ